MDVKVSFANNDRATEFVITINRPEFNQLNADSDTKLGYSDTDLDTDSDTPNANSDTIRPKITNKQRDIVNFCNVPRSSKDQQIIHTLPGIGSGSKK